MARKEIILQVFVASPSDVKDERDLLEGVIRELNISWSKRLGTRLELVRWETHGYPGFGDDAQQVLNEQFPDDYDIFIGIFWSRFGTPTGRAGSGTEEEFNRAVARYKKTPDEVKIMVYFKTEGINPLDVDLEQVANLKKFRNRIRKEGAFVWEFKNADEFEQLLRMQLASQVQSIRDAMDTEDIRREKYKVDDEDKGVSNQEIETSDDDDDLGYLDYIELVEDNFVNLAVATEKINNYIETIGSEINRGTHEFKECTLADGSFDMKKGKAVTNKIAEAMVEFSTSMEKEIVKISQHFKEGSNAFQQVLLFSGDFMPPERNDRSELSGHVRGTKEIIHKTISSIVDMREAASELPRITKEFNRAKRQTLNVLDRFVGELEIAERLASEMERAAERYVNG